jgi:hypothetical protein
LYAPFREREPDARIGRSILAYHIDYPASGVDRVVVVGPLAGDLDRATLGGQADRQLRLKWAGDGAAVLDMQGKARYITRGSEPIAGFAPDLHDALIANAERLGNDSSGALRLFAIDTRAALGAKLASLAKSPIFTPEGSALSLPIEFEGGLSLLGYDLTASAGSPVDLVTYWQARAPIAPRLAIFAHLLDADGRILAQGDGLNVRLSALEDGDVVLQHFTIDHPTGAATLAIGLYDPVDGHRMRVRDHAIDQIHIHLGLVQE